MGSWALAWMGLTGLIAGAVLWRRSRAERQRAEESWLERVGDQAKLSVALVGALAESEGRPPTMARKHAFELVREVVSEPEILGEFAGVPTRNLARDLTVMQLRAELDRAFELYLKSPAFQVELDRRLVGEQARLFRQALEGRTTRSAP